MKLEITYLSIEELNPYEGNAKQHPEEQVEQIKKSIEQFGFNDPIAIWGEHNTIIEGHGRLLAAQELGLGEVPVIRLDGLTDEQRRAYTLAHNKLTLNSKFDIDLLSDEIKNITDFDMTDFGFSDFEIAIFNDDNEPEPYDNDLIDQYSEHEDDYLAKKRVIISYTEETRHELEKMLGVEEIGKIVYDITELI